MNYELRNIVLVISIIFLFIFASYFLFSRQPNQYVPETWAKLDCIHITHVSSGNLQPDVKRGVILSLNRCIRDSKNLDIDTIVAFHHDGTRKVGRIQDKSVVNDTYTVVTNNSKNTQLVIPSSDVIAASPQFTL